MKICNNYTTKPYDRFKRLGYLVVLPEEEVDAELRMYFREDPGGFRRIEETKVESTTLRISE
jgi:hypothetical protein